MSLLPTARELMGPWLTANFVLILGLSLIIVYQAYRGYRRHGVRPLLFLALGVVLLAIVPIIVSIIGARIVTATTYGTTIAPLTESIRVIGLACIVYSIYGRR